jgi:hypothetical protein
MKLLPILVAVALLALASAILLGVSERRKDQVRVEMRVQTAELNAYQNGFVAGMNATLRHVNIVSNVVELAPILAEMSAGYTNLHLIQSVHINTNQ